MSSTKYLQNPANLAPNSTTDGLNRAVAQVFTWTAKTTDTFTFTGPDGYEIRYRIGLGAYTTSATLAPVASGAVDGYQHTFAGATFAAGTTYGWQVRMRESGGSDFTDWSSEAFFRAETATAPVITAPTAGATPTATGALAVTWTLTTQQSYQVRVLNGTTVEYSTGWISSTALRSTTVPAINAGARTIEVSTKGVAGGAPGVATVAITVIAALPATPTAAAGTVSDPGSIGVRYSLAATSTHPAPTGSQPAVASVEYSLRKSGDTTTGGVIGSATSSAGSWLFTYPLIPAGTWEISAVAVSADGRRSARSAWVALAVQPNISGVVLYDPISGAAVWLRLNDDGAVEQLTKPSATLRYVGRKYPVVEFDALAEELGVNVSKVQIKTVDAPTQLRLLRQLARVAGPVCYRDKRGRRVIGTLTVNSITDTFYGYDVGLSVQAVDSADAFTWEPSWP